jgi:hypothetical protein
MNIKRIPAPVGSVFGELTVIGPPVAGKMGNYLPCKCSCDLPVFVLWGRLRSGGTLTCGTGCRPKVKQERLYGIWSNMKERCSNPNNKSFPRYGGRGITYDPSWEKYPGFRKWAMGAGYEDPLTLERNDNDGNYEPGNCRWIPKNEQSRNRRSNITLSLRGETKILKDWADDPSCVVKYHTLYARIRNGWVLEDALSKPLGSRKLPTR